MSKPPPPNEWQQPHAERIAQGRVNYPPSGTAANALLLQQPFPYWPMPLPPGQGALLSSAMSLLRQPTQAPPTPVPFSSFSLNSVNNAAVREHEKNGSQNGNDMDTTTIYDMMDDNNEHVGTSEDTTTATNGTDEDDEYTDMLHVGQVFANEKAFKAAVEKYCNDRNYDTNSSTSHNKNTTYFRTTCVRGGVFKSESKGGEGSRMRTSQKVNCQFRITGSLVTSNDILKSNGSLTAESVKVVTLNLEHTNTCKGADELIRATTKQLRGRNYSSTQLSHLQKECVSGRYSTTNVKDWLTEQGHTDVTLKEATNLRYRLLIGKKIKGYVEDPSHQQMGKMTDYLLNYDLKKEVTAGGQKSVDNLVCVHKGLSSQIPGYDYRMTTDSENRFSGTAWQTGRMRKRLRDFGMMIFLDDSRSGINTAGFCFWNVVVVDHNGKIQTVMGAMTMSPTNEAVYWVLSSMVQMTPESADIVQCLMSDLGEKTFLCAPSNTIVLQTHIHFIFYCQVLVSSLLREPYQMWSFVAHAHGT